MQKGRCLYRMDDYVDAQRILEKYLEEYPDGMYAKDVKVYLKNMSVIRTSQRKATCSVEDDTKGDIAYLEDMITSSPYNATYHYELANAYWKIKEYDKAADEYLAATQIDAALRENELIKQRLTVDDQGNIVPLTPELQRAKERELNPLVIFDTHDYNMRQTRDFYSARETYILVAGKVRNQSSRLIRNIVVEVSFYNVHRELLDVRNYRIGSMGPGDVRGFVVKSSFSDDIYNVYSYEAETFYE